MDCFARTPAIPDLTLQTVAPVTNQVVADVRASYIRGVGGVSGTRAIDGELRDRWFRQPRALRHSFYRVPIAVPSRERHLRVTAGRILAQHRLGRALILDE